MLADLRRLLQRFCARVVVEPSGCWRWTGGYSQSGWRGVFYPALWWGSKARGKMWRVNRLLLVLATTPAAEAWAANVGFFADYDASHICDHSWCVNPDHLQWETHCANVQNQQRRKRQQRQQEAA